MYGEMQNSFHNSIFSDSVEMANKIRINPGKPWKTLEKAVQANGLWQSAGTYEKREF